MKRLLSFVLAMAMLLTMAPSVMAEEAPRIKNVIYMIPDGGGYAPYDFANMVKMAGGFEAGLYPNRTPTDTNKMTLKDYLVGSMRTADVTGGVTDSAAAGTAMSTGYKTYGGRLGINSKGRPVANLVEAAQSVGKATGVISDYTWVHATPAAFGAHVMSRNDYYNIYQQMENKLV